MFSLTNSGNFVLFDILVCLVSQKFFSNSLTVFSWVLFAYATNDQGQQRITTKLLFWCPRTYIYPAQEHVNHWFILIHTEGKI